MGRTYKRNDPYNSRRPKSIREKRQWGNSKKSSTNYDDFSTDFSTGKYQRKNSVDDYAQGDYES